MDRREFVKTGTYAALASKLVPQSRRAYEVGAIYFPNFHVDPRNEELHGKGWTEWEILKRGEPKFQGHEQPKIPLWGYVDEANPRVFERKIAAARDAGINHFIFDWYWYDGRPFLQRALENGYLESRNKADVHFCLMWANHDWLRLMPARLRERDKRPLYMGTYSPSEFDAVTDYIISHYFKDPSYLLVNGAPYFSIYVLSQLIDRMGGLETAQAAIARFRQKTRNANFPDLHLNAMGYGLQGIHDVPGVLTTLGIKSVTNYTWAHHYDFRSFPAVEYKDAMESAPKYWTKAKDLFGVPYEIDVSMGWDPSPRACQSDVFEHAGYPFIPILSNNTPALFHKSLAEAKAYLDQNQDEPVRITVNSWNEWTEGSHLEPDSRHGMAYLNAIRDVFGH